MNLILLLFLISCTADQNPTYQKCTELSFLPMPKSIRCNLQDQRRHQIKDPCNIAYFLKTSGNSAEIPHILELIEDQQYKTFKCRLVHFENSKENLKRASFQHLVEIDLVDLSLKSAFTQKQESYSLKITREYSFIRARHYTGFVRGLQTLLQSVTCTKKYNNCFMTALPIEIEDEPLFEYRGIMVDTSRHFLPIKILEQTIDAMMYNKMNVLHWHIVDQDSFPLVLKSHPELAQFASFSVSERYSVDQVKKLVHYAMVRGVRIIPEIDTPGHAASWAKAPQNSDIGCTFGENQYKGPLDVTLHKTYEIMKQVFKEIFELFPDPYVHLGGDEVQLVCLTNLTDFVKLENITPNDVEAHYRRKQKQILRQLNQTKKFIYWTNGYSIAAQPDDIIHWWDSSSLIPSDPKSKVIISQFRGEFYIDMGMGQIHGWPYFDYSTWYQMYHLNIGRQLQRGNQTSLVMGGVLTLWGEISNMYTHHAKIWARSSAMAERFWTAEEHKIKPDFERRLVAQQKLMNRRGIPTTPITRQQCELKPELCQFEYKKQNV